MNMLKLTAAAALVAASLSASAMTTINDEELSTVSGQDGVSIAADLNVNIGAFTYTDSGSSVSFNNISVKGLMAMTIDVIGGAEFSGDIVGGIIAHGGAADVATATPVAGAMSEPIITRSAPTISTTKRSTRGSCRMLSVYSNPSPSDGSAISGVIL